MSRLLFVLILVGIAIASKVVVETRNVTIIDTSNFILVYSEDKFTGGKSKNVTRVVTDIRSDKPKDGSNAPLHFRLKYFDSNKDSKTRLMMHIGFIELQEFLPASTNPFLGFNPATDTKVSTTHFSKVDWTFSAVTTTVDANGYHDYSFWVADASNILNFTVRMSDGDFVYQGVTYGPLQTKLDINIQNYPYKGNNTYLCLHTRFQTASKMDYSHGQQATTIVSSNLEMAFGWAPTLLINGLPSTVVVANFTDYPVDSMDSSDAPDETALHTFYSFNAVHPTTISWDPMLWVNSASPMMVSIVLLLCSLLLALF